MNRLTPGLRPATRHLVPLLAVAAAVAVALAACSTAQSPPPGSPTEVTVPSAGTSSGGSSASPPTADPAASAGAGTADPNVSLGPVVASRSGSVDGSSADLVLYPIARDGDLAHLTFTVRSAAGPTVGDAFADRRSHDYEADGITLIDAGHKKLYLVASHGNGLCLCTSTGNLVLGEEPAVISASFAAPPEELPTMDVQIPGFGVFTRVPVV